MHTLNHSGDRRISYCSQAYLGDESSFAVIASTPVSVISRVCSNCAVGLPSLVAAVQLSGQFTGLAEPRQIMGSIVKVWPTSMVPSR